MDSEITLLQDIKTGVWILVYIVGIGMTSFLIRNMTIAYKTIKAERNNVFYNGAYAKFESGQFDELVDFCSEQLKKKPKDVYAYWFLSKAHYEKQEYEKAEEYLNQVGELAPSWDREYVEPLRKKIDSARVSSFTSNP